MSEPTTASAEAPALLADVSARSSHARPVARVPRRSDWLAVRKPLSGRQSTLLTALAFLLPLLAWSVVSYVPFVWHPLIKVAQPGSVSFLQVDSLIEREVFDSENTKARAEHRALAGHS